MPEIGEIARIVHFLRRHCIGRKIAKVVAEEDTIVYGKVGTSAAAFEKAMAGKTILDARQQGKYFWLVMSSPPHPLMHFGMTGWIKFSNDQSFYYKKSKSEEIWPPRFMKFMLHLEGDPACQVAFVDGRRLARIRLVDVPADQMRMTTPLKENGPDPVIDKDILTREWLWNKLQTKRVPIKALLLNQAVMSGVGNWVGDEVLYHARIHPEQYSNTLDRKQSDTLHDKLVEVCTTACDMLAESHRFPQNWLMKHRWGKGKAGGNYLPNGEKILHVTVGGRTSAFVPSVQKKTGAVAAGAVEENVEDDEEVKHDAELDGVRAQSGDEEAPVVKEKKKVVSKKGKGGAEVKKTTPKAKPAVKSKKHTSADDSDAIVKDEEGLKKKSSKKQQPQTKRATPVKKSRKRTADDNDDAEVESKIASKKARKDAQPKHSTSAATEEDSGRRRSRRLSSKV